jgi:hypothetical protein
MGIAAIWDLDLVLRVRLGSQGRLRSDSPPHVYGVQ